MTPRRSFFISAALAVLVLVVALACRFHYIQEFGFDSSRGDAVLQVQGRSPIAKSPASTDLDCLEFNLIEKGPRQGFECPAPLSPRKTVKEKDNDGSDVEVDEPVYEPTAHRAPLYAYFRWLLWTINYDFPAKEAKQQAAGAEPARTTFPAPKWFDATPPAVYRLAQMVLGSLTCMLYFVIALRAFGANRLLALLVGLATAAYPFWVINTAEIEDGTLAAFFLAWALALGIRIGQKGGVIRSYLFGLALAGLALTRAALLPFTIIAELWFFVRCRRVPAGGLCAILVVLGYATGLAPWFLRTYEALGEPVPIATTSWYHLWVGNNPLADGSAFTWSMTKKLDLDSPGLLKTISETRQVDRYQLLAPIVMQEIETHPGETFKRRVKAALQFYLGVNKFQQSPMFARAEGKASPSWLRPLLIGTLATMYFFALFGWRWSYGWKSRTTLLTLALIWIPLPYILSHAGPLHDSRLPLDGVFVTMAVVGLFGMIPLIGTRLLAGENQAED
jgi:hypothetical protein